ncbi:unnamed protein product [Adineta steineri]|uniref:Uncharacterized protein n=1 Tax=Adineta steineri TaxID=433720 RepID=A0A818K4E7_9BILA|nr:unnamed protein product [Adineta steineri]
MTAESSSKILVQFQPNTPKKFPLTCIFNRYKYNQTLNSYQKIGPAIPVTIQDGALDGGINLHLSPGEDSEQCYKYCTTSKPLAHIGQYRAHQTRPATNFKGALRDGIELHLTASEEKMPRFLLTATVKDSQQMEFKSVTSIMLDRDSNEFDYIHDIKLLPTTIIDPHLLRYISRLRINYMNSLSFYRIITLLSSVLGQLSHFSLKLKGFTSISDPLTIYQIESLEIFDITLTFQNAQPSCTLLSNRLSNLKKLNLNICDAFYPWRWNPSCVVDGKNKSTRLRIVFSNSKFNATPCFPCLIRRQLHQYPLNRPFRLRFSPNAIALWL